MACIFWLLFELLGWSNELILNAILVIWLLPISEIDFREKVIPNQLVGMGVLTGLTTIILTQPDAFMPPKAVCKFLQNQEFNHTNPVRT